MPLLVLTTWPALTDPGLQQAIAHELGDHTTRLLHKRPSVTAIVFQDSPVAWFIGGEPMTGLAGVAERTFSLEIRITAGTNTPDQKAAWIAAVWNTMRQAVPGLVAEASYVRVIETAPGDWGYGGRTQAARTSPRP